MLTYIVICGTFIVTVVLIKLSERDNKKQDFCHERESREQLPNALV